jgi:type II restriction enzyme
LPDLRSSVSKIFSEIEIASWHAFELPSAIKLMEDLGCRQIKSSSRNKNDLVLTTHEGADNREIELWFSIKSSIWSAPTLLNPSSHTNFVFHILWIEKWILDNLSTRKEMKAGALVKTIYDFGWYLVYDKPKSVVFNENLMTSDSGLPIIIPEILITYYRWLGRKTSEIVEKTFEHSDRVFDLWMNVQQVEYKLKNFLENVALWMTPSKRWSGKDETEWGYLIVGADGKIICLHKYWRDLFKDYLFDNTAFDTPSTSRYDYWKIYMNSDNQHCVDLNLQIRFVK